MLVSSCGGPRSSVAPSPAAQIPVVTAQPFLRISGLPETTRGATTPVRAEFVVGNGAYGSNRMDVAVACGGQTISATTVPHAFSGRYYSFDVPIAGPCTASLTGGLNKYRLTLSYPH